MGRYGGGGKEKADLKVGILVTFWGFISVLLVLLCSPWLAWDSLCRQAGLNLRDLATSSLRVTDLKVVGHGACISSFYVAVVES